MKNRMIRKIGIALTAAFLVTLFTMSNIYAEDEPVVVSMGDSYSSGEGVPPFIGQTKDLSKVYSQDWLAHRSDNSWPGKLEVPTGEELKKDRAGKDNNYQGRWYFVAASGAETCDLKNQQIKDVAKLAYNKNDISIGMLSGAPKLDPQLSIFSKIKDKGEKVDYVTITIGGNDLGFSSIMATAAMKSTFLNVNNLKTELNNAWFNFENEHKSPDPSKRGEIVQPIREDIHDAYKDIESATDEVNNKHGETTIIVANYPRLLSENEALLAASPFSKKEAEMINAKVDAFNTELGKLVVEQCKKKEKMNIVYVDVSKAFGGHEAYTLKPAIRGLELIARSEDLKESGKNVAYSAYSFHPNEKRGIEIYRSCVQKALDGIEGKKNTTEKDVVGAWYWAGSGASSPIKLNKDGTLEIEEVIDEWEERGSWSCKGNSITIIRDGVKEKLKYNKNKDILYYEEGGEGSCYKRYNQSQKSNDRTYLDYFSSINKTHKTFGEIDDKYNLEATDEMTDSWMVFASDDDRFHFSFHSTGTKMIDNGLGDSWEVPDDPKSSDLCERMSGSAEDMLGITKSISEQEFQENCKDQLMFPMGGGPGVDLATSGYSGLVDICTLSDGNTYHILLKDVSYGGNIDPDTEVFIQYYPFDKNKDSIQMEGGY